jgi:hypothetical protein
MAGRGPQTFKKRQKEQQRKEKQQEKLAKRLQRKQEKQDGTWNPDADIDVDPDAPIEPVETNDELPPTQPEALN